MRAPSSLLLGRQIDGVNASASWNFGEFRLGLKEMMHVTSLMMFPLQDICVYCNTRTHALAHTHYTWKEDERKREFQLYHSFSQINVQLSNVKYCNYLMTLSPNASMNLSLKYKNDPLVFLENR